jgi:hypothetical protein
MNFHEFFSMDEVLKDTDTALYPFSVIEKFNKPQIQISIDGELKEYTPGNYFIEISLKFQETLSAIVLTRVSATLSY